MIVRALRDFLVETAQLNDPVRADGLRVFRDEVRSHVYEGHIPRAHTGPLAVTLTMISEQDFNGIASPAPFVAAIIQVIIWAKDTDEISGATRGRLVARALRRMLTQYRGPLNDEVEVQTIGSEGGASEQLLRPSDASGNWNYRYIITYMLGVPIEVPTGVD